MKIAAEESSRIDGKDYRFIRVERDNPDDKFERMILIVKSSMAVNINPVGNQITLTFEESGKK